MLLLKLSFDAISKDFHKLKTLQNLYSEVEGRGVEEEVTLPSLPQVTIFSNVTGRGGAILTIVDKGGREHMDRENNRFEFNHIC